MGKIYPFNQTKEERTQGYRALFKDDPVLRAMMFTKLNKKVAHKKAKAEEVLWRIDGKELDRYDMMNLLVHLVSEGYSLAEVCQDCDFPTLKEVREWCPNHPSFERDLAEADKVRGELLDTLALKVAMDSNNKTVAADKLRYEALSKTAARLNAKFQDKQVVQTEDTSKNQSDEQIRERLMAMMDANPELKAILAPTLELGRGPLEKEGATEAAPLDGPSHPVTSVSHREGE